MRALVDLLAPPVCDGCGRLAQPPWCVDCDAVATAEAVDRPCARCAGPLAPDHPCWDPQVPIRNTVALTTWRDPVATAVLRAKLEGRAEVFAALGRRMSALVVDPPELIVAVPTDRRRARRRGSDHTRVMAAALGTAIGVPVARPLRTGTRTVDRGAAVAERRVALPAGAFVARGAASSSVRSRWVLVVDDVLTTGGTLAAVARALTDLGAARVDAAVTARAGRHPLGGVAAARRAPVAPDRAQK